MQQTGEHARAALALAEACSYSWMRTYLIAVNPGFVIPNLDPQMMAM